jgi:hypothetical protein
MKARTLTANPTQSMFCVAHARKFLRKREASRKASGLMMAQKTR